MGFVPGMVEEEGQYLNNGNRIADIRIEGLIHLENHMEDQEVEEEEFLPITIIIIIMNLC